MIKYRDEFRKSIKESYPKEILVDLYNVYFTNWIAEDYIGSSLNLFELSLISNDTNIQFFLDLMEQAFLIEDRFKNIYGTLSDDIRELFEYITWEGAYPIEDKDKFFEKSNSYKKGCTLKDEYKFFKVKEDQRKTYSLTLPRGVIKILRQLLDKPRSYYIYESKVQKVENVKNSEKEVLEKLHLLFNFYAQGSLKLSSSNKLLKESKRSIQKYCGIDEFYKNSKDLDFLKSENFGLLFFWLEEDYLNKEWFTPSNYKKLINLLLDGQCIKKEYTYTKLYLNYLKGIKHVKKGPEKIVEVLQGIKDVLKELPKNKTVSVKNIIKYLTFRNYNLEIIDPQDVYDYIYINEANYGRTKITDYDGYEKYILVPLIKSLLFLMGTLGVLEIYYKKPNENNGLYLKSGYLSKYDGITHVKLTELGEYILGRREDYDIGYDVEEAEIHLESDRLLLTIIGNAPARAHYFERISNKVGENKYKFTPERFLKGVESREKLQEKITEFKERIENPLEKIWEEFFEDLLKKSESISEKKEIVVLKLQEDKELIKIIGRNKELGKLILKAENYYVLVEEENITKVSEILKEYGYFIPR